MIDTNNEKLYNIIKHRVEDFPIKKGIITVVSTSGNYEISKLSEEAILSLERAVAVVGGSFADAVMAFENMAEASVINMKSISSIKEVISEQCFEIPVLKEEKQHEQYGWYRKFEKKKF